MKLYITLDVEGVTTVTAKEQGSHGSPEWNYMRVLLTQEINAAIEGAQAAGAEEFLVNEGHGKQRNIIPHELRREALLLTGREKLLHYMHRIDDGYEGMFMVGFHAGPDKQHAVLPHTFYAFDLQVNGITLSEVGLGMALAGHFNIPTLMVTGDHETCLEAQGHIPNIETVAVKEGVNTVSAIHLHPEVAQERIKETAQRAIERRGEIEPFFIEPPYVMDIQLYQSLMADVQGLIPGCERTGARSVRYRADSFYEIFKLFLLSSHLSMTTYGLSVMG
jgi:D-amino peptidase